MVVGSSVQGEQNRALHQDARKVWQIENAIGTGIAIVLAIAILHGPFSETSWRFWDIPLLSLIGGLSLFEALVSIPRRYRFYRYALVDDCLVIVRGRFLFKRFVFPLRQVLYVHTRQGPVLRHFGLFKVHIGTIAEPHAFGPLPLGVVREFQHAVNGWSAPE